MASRISTRISLRWPPGPSFENTDTIVMSVGIWYVDLRIDNQSSKIDWAIAGQRLVENKEPLRVVFTHELDSHNAFSALDSGTFTPLPNGDSLEEGSMPRPDLPDAPVSEYEEIWRTLDPRVGPEGHNARVSWILESVDSSLDRENGKVVKTFLGRVGGTFLVLRQTQFHARSHGGEVSKTGSEVSARREEWEEGSGWIAKYVVGDDAGSLPSMCAGLGGEDEGSWKEGGKARLGETGYVVRALERV